MKMIRATFGLFFLACSGCAANAPQTAAAPGCRIASPQAYQDCQNQTGDQAGVYVGGTVSYGMVHAVR
jgi:hypothetical protein